MRVELRRSAQVDLAAGYRFYERQSPGRGSYFLTSLRSDLEILANIAGVHAVHFGLLHRMLARRFPHAIYYRVEDQTVRIYAILDCRRSPAWIRAKLRKAGQQ
jgi:plasmid stabilization system protein ParE